MAIVEINKIKNMQEIVDDFLSKGKKIGVVPTMGYLHEGHGSLIEAAARENDIIIVTVFVNPLQFAAHEDLSTYPRNFKRDIEIIESNGGTIVFAPSVEEMYPQGFETNISIGGITRKFEGAFRPTHFDGVATIVTKLFAATKPHNAYFGQKDFQQVTVIKQLVRDLNIDVLVKVQDTIRESDGLAKSSRNIYLSHEEREQAVIIYKALSSAMTATYRGEKDRGKLVLIMNRVLKSMPNLHIDYASASRADTLEEPSEFTDDEDIVFLIAVRLGKTRLIDNMVFRAK